MSGIEVAGIVLGVIPILFGAIDVSKDGYRRAGAGFRKRKYVEKLARALLLQQQILEGSVKLVVKASGCDNVLRLEDDPIGYLNDEYVREQVLDFLGPKNDAAFSGTLEQCCDIVKKIAGSISGLVPAYKDPTDDLLGIIKANQDANDARLDLLPRVKLVFGVNELKSAIQELDDTSNALDRFIKVVLSDRHASDETTSRKAIKLAKALRQVRRFAGNLYLALFQGWSAGCHSEHEAKLFLEDRVDTAEKILKQIGKDSCVPILAFQLLFAVSIAQGQMWWHETAVQVFNDGDNVSSNSSVTTLTPASSHVTLISPQTTKDAKLEVTYVKDLCDEIEAARCNKRQIAFVVTENQKMGTIRAEKQTLVSYRKVDTMTLKALLLSGTRHHYGGPILPWKFRMLLALRLASNLLQLLQTQWLQRPWSKDVVYFLLLSTGNTNSASQDPLQVDVSRPCVSLTFDATSQSSGLGRVEPKEALLELGILLLEIWHEKTLETRFSLKEAPTRYYERLALAVEWLDDTNNPLPDLYEKAVSHCIRSVIGGESRPPDWEDIGFWGAVCGDIIEPLSKNCRQWR